MQRAASRAAAEAEADSDSCADEGEDAEDDDVDASLALAWNLQAEYDSSAAWMDAALACGRDDDAGEPAAGGAPAAPGLQGPGFVGWRWQEGAPRAARRPPPAPPPPLRADDDEVIRTVRPPFAGGRHVTWTWDGAGSVWRPDAALLSGKPYLQVCASAGLPFNEQKNVSRLLSCSLYFVPRCASSPTRTARRRCWTRTWPWTSCANAMPSSTPATRWNTSPACLCWSWKVIRVSACRAA